MHPASVLLVFLDGIGLAPPGPDNPLSGPDLSGLHMWAGGRPWTLPVTPVPDEMHHFAAVDACLGVPGLPQSGTGQATLFTGINCARLAQRHFGPWPHSSTRNALRSHNVFRRVREHTGRDTAFANAFPEAFFERATRTDRWSTTTRCCLDSGTPLRTLEDLASGNAVAADITGAGLRRFTGHTTEQTEEHAADRLLAVAQQHAFTLFEYFLTDKAGHAQSPGQAVEVLQSVSRFLGHLHACKPDGMTIVITSDHGNLEDLSVRTHTRNPVPLAVSGPGAGAFVDVVDLTDVVPAIIQAFRGVR
ncbi:MAG: peptidase [Rhodothermales bacterium]